MAGSDRHTGRGGRLRPAGEGGRAASAAAVDPKALEREARWLRVGAAESDAGTASERLARAAADRGLLDVAYAFADSPFGPLLVAVTPRGLVRVAYPDRDPDRELEDLAARVSPRVLASALATERVRRELEEYFSGRRREFDAPVDLAAVPGFTSRVLRAAARIPYGRVSTYRDVAARAGNPKATRAAGNALGANPVPIVVPCHRVLPTGGGLGGYTGGLDRKRLLLRLEGVLQGDQA